MNTATICPVAAVVLGFVAVAGCGMSGSNPVEGVVTLDGKPLSGAKVSFTSATVPQGQLEGLFVGETNEQGQYSLRPASDEVDGIPAGTYRVFITTVSVDPRAPDVDRPQPPSPERVPPQYRKGIEFTVPEVGTTEANFELKSR